jgi:hypothetical protein
MADGILVSLGAAMLSFNNRTGVSQQAVVLVVSAVTMGLPWFLVAALLINVLGVPFVVVVAAFSRFWTELPVFEFNDLACMVLGIVVNGAAAPVSSLRVWNGDPKDEIFGRVSAKLDLMKDKQGVEVVLR